MSEATADRVPPKAAGPGERLADGGCVQANSLIVKLDLKGDNGDSGKVQAFLSEVQSDLDAGILTQSRASSLLGPGNLLLLGITRR